MTSLASVDPPPDRPAAPVVTGAELRSAMANFATGVTVVSVLTGGRPHAMTATAFVSLSLDPPLVLVSVGQQNRLHPRILAAGAWTVSILAADQEAVARTFARTGRDLAGQFEGVATHPAPVSGAPVITGALAWLDCQTEATHRTGDHTVLIGRVRAVGQESIERPPLTYYRGTYSTLP